ncbi:hypothetical protein QEH56_14040 [Pelagicoccus enzymogenes]|uniref:hypothetical protein n=1 Tax=Pelagicoccus enzymogenes TaxID=2773457 RepID=UPI00280EFDAB|nr:hypothetical protein [Pelagicoccus enzymogenes]MDQ8199286.1 hypothetical protein [Pelagicoccus enzymogenes]
MSRLLKRCAQGVRVNIVPGLVLQSIACVVVGVYYFVPEARGAYDWIAKVKVDYGYWYSAVTTGVFGGLVPFLYLVSVGKVERSDFWAVGIFFLGAWSWKGIEIDFLYRMQAILFGSDNQALTVLKKVLFDQFVFCPIWSAPVTALLYRWKDCGFSWRRFKRELDRDFFLLEVLGVLVAIWVVWIPGTAFIYSMPSSLQLPLFQLVLCFFVLLVSVIGKKRVEEVAVA